MNFAELNFREPFLGKSKYRLVTEEKVISESDGPNVVVNFKDGNFKMSPSGTIMYGIDVRSSVAPLDVYLYYIDNSRKLHRTSIPKEYNRIGQWQRLEWVATKDYLKVEVVADLGCIN